MPQTGWTLSDGYEGKIRSTNSTWVYCEDEESLKVGNIWKSNRNIFEVIEFGN